MIKVNNVVKTYKQKKILEDVTLNIEGVYGLIGPNGSGKTTLMRAIAGLISIDEGEILVESKNSNSKKIKDVRNRIGYLPQDFNIYPKATVWECLEHIAILKGLTDKEKRESTIDGVLDKVNLKDFRQSKVHSLSGGMRKRLGIGQVFLTNPEIIIVDEPTAGLDILERIRFRNLLREVAEEKTIVISSHIVEDVEFLCTKLGIIKDGRVLSEGTPSEISLISDKTVWDVQIYSNELNDFFKKHTVIDIKQIDAAVLNVRILSKERPPNALPLKPSLIDGYLAAISREEEKINDF